MKLYVIAGESSGDMHTANLLAELNLLNPIIETRGMGGNLMQKQGVHLIQHYNGLNVVGLAEVIKKLPTLLKVIRKIKQDIIAWKPDAILLTDYPAFNLRIAKFCKKINLPVYYYISPQIWAWKENRICDIRKYVNHMAVILPFEPAFYKKHGIEVTFVGHPLIDIVNRFRNQENTKLTFSKPILAILPGSRRHEVKAMLPTMLQAANHFKDEFDIVIGGAPSLPTSFYTPFLINHPHVHWVQNQTYALLNSAYAAIVTSGTATLETALFNVPQLVCYKGNRLSYEVARRLIKIKYISLVNLILDKPCVDELIQNQMNEQQIQQSLQGILNQRREQMLNDYKHLQHILGNSGASMRAASSLHDWMNLL